MPSSARSLSSSAAQAGAQTSIEIPNPPAREAGGWRVTWTSMPGRTYALQRWHSENLNEPASPSWIEVARVVATNNTSSALDATAATSSRRFYRVVQLADTWRNSRN